MKPINDLCSQCGFKLDPNNPSESVCPACGADPGDRGELVHDLHLAAALDDGAVSAERRQATGSILDAEVSAEPEVIYCPDPELDFAIAEAESLMQALTEGPILIAGNRLVN